MRRKTARWSYAIVVLVSLVVAVVMAWGITEMGVVMAQISVIPTPTRTRPPTNTPTPLPPTSTPTSVPPTATYTPSPTPTNTSEPTGESLTRLNISDVSCVDCSAGPETVIEVHFVLAQAPEIVANYSAVAYTVQLPDGTVVSSSAHFDKHTGQVIHYEDQFVGNFGTYTLLAASLTVDGINYALANANSLFDVYPSHVRPGWAR